MFFNSLTPLLQYLRRLFLDTSEQVSFAMKTCKADLLLTLLRFYLRVMYL